MFAHNFMKNELVCVDVKNTVRVHLRLQSTWCTICMYLELSSEVSLWLRWPRQFSYFDVAASVDHTKNTYYPILRRCIESVVSEKYTVLLYFTSFDMPLLSPVAGWLIFSGCEWLCGTQQPSFNLVAGEISVNMWVYAQTNSGGFLM